MMKLLILSLSVLFFISCSKENETPNIIEFNDNWTKMDVPISNPLSGVWGTSNILVAVGGSVAVDSSQHLGIILKHDENEWNIEKDNWDARMILNDVNGKSNNEIYAIGTILDGISSKGILLKYDGLEWKEYNCPVGLHKIKIIDQEIYITGTNSLYRMDNDSLTEIFSHNFHSYDLWGTSSDDLYLVGFSGEKDFVFKYDGLTWTNLLQDSNISGCFLQSIVGTSSKEIFATGTGGTFLKYDGKEWVIIKSDFDPIYEMVVVDSKNIFFVTGLYGGHGKIYKYDGETFQIEYESHVDWLNDIRIIDNLGIVAVGSEGAIFSKRIK